MTLPLMTYRLHNLSVEVSGFYLKFLTIRVHMGFICVEDYQNFNLLDIKELRFTNILFIDLQE